MTDPFRLFFSPYGRLRPVGFFSAVLFVYALLLIAPNLPPGLFGPLGPLRIDWLIALLQFGLIWSWYALHHKRLRDSDRRAIGAAIIAIVYALAITALLVVTVLTADHVMGTGTSGAPSMGSGFLVFALVLYWIGVTAGGNSLTVVFVGLVLVAVVAVLFVLGFSVWTGTRPSAKVD